MTASLSSHFESLASRDRSQKIHITDTATTPILSTNADSPALTSLSQALLTSNSAVEHLGVGRIKRIHAQYTNGEVIQIARLEGKTGVTATIAGAEVRRSLEMEKILNIVHGALEGNEETEAHGEGNGLGRLEEPNKSDDREILGSS